MLTHLFSSIVLLEMFILRLEQKCKLTVGYGTNGFVVVVLFSVLYFYVFDTHFYSCHCMFCERVCVCVWFTPIYLGSFYSNLFDLIVNSDFMWGAQLWIKRSEREKRIVRTNEAQLCVQTNQFRSCFFVVVVVVRIVLCSRLFSSDSDRMNEWKGSMVKERKLKIYIRVYLELTLNHDVQ